MGLITCYGFPSIRLRMMGGGPRTYPGGVNKWEWRRMQREKRLQFQKAKILRERQVFEERRRMAESQGFYPFDYLNPQLRDMADRFRRRSAEDLWCEKDGPFLFIKEDGQPSARFLPKDSIHSARFYHRKGRSPPLELGKQVLPTAELHTDKAARLQNSNLLTRGDNVGDVFPMRCRFNQLKLSPLLVQAVREERGLELMSPDQEAIVPVILEGRDLLAVARAGSGRSIAVLVPAIQKTLAVTACEKKLTRFNNISILILCPTQHDILKAQKSVISLIRFLKNIGVQILMGGINVQAEAERIQTLPCQILIASPTSLVNHIETTSGFVGQLQSLKLLVLDEISEMLDMGSQNSILHMLEMLPGARQNIILSSRKSEEVNNIARAVLKPGHFVLNALSIYNEPSPLESVGQVIIVPQEEQLLAIYSILRQHQPNHKIIVFCISSGITEFLAALYKSLGLNIMEVHYHKMPSYRREIFDDFCKSKIGCALFVSNISVRELVYLNATLILQVGLPPSKEHYIQRMGLTSSIGKRVNSILMLLPFEEPFICNLIGAPIKMTSYPNYPPQEQVKDALKEMKFRTLEKAYQSWLGYYISMAWLGLDKRSVIELAEEFSMSIGLSRPPALLQRTVRKMGLSGLLH